MKKIKLITSQTKQGKLMILGLGDDNNMYLWNNQTGVWTLYKQPEPQVKDPKRQSLDDVAKHAAKQVDFKGISIRQMLKQQP